MRILIFYDIYETEEVDKLAKKFRENLISLGYFMIQYSIYCKCIGSHTMYDYEIKKIRKILPLKANVRILLLSEKQYQNMVIISGEKNLNEIYNDREDYIEI